MITAAPEPRQPAALVPVRWQQALREAVRDPRELLDLLGLDRLAPRLSDEAMVQFPLRVPRGFVARMRRGDPSDPLLRQVLPLDDEMRPMPGFALDAVGDTSPMRRKPRPATAGARLSTSSARTPRSKRCCFPVAIRCRCPTASWPN
jgi:hypothetical protein